MKKALFFSFLFASFIASSQDIVREELTAEEIQYLATDITSFSKTTPEDFKNSTINNLTNYEFEIQYDKKAIYRGAIKKPSVSDIGRNMYRKKASFCFDYNLFDIETKLELTESKIMNLSETETGERYLWTDNYVLFEKDRYSKNILVNDKLTEKLVIRFSKQPINIDF